MDSEKYKLMCLKILENKTFYKQISPIMIQSFNKEFYKIIDKAYNDGTISQTLWEFMRIKHPRVPTLYALPKVHKDLKNPPGRPIISGNGNITETTSQVIDSYLRPHVTKLASYTKDTVHLLQILERLVIPTNALLVKIDVESLYNNIPHQKGLEAVKQTLSQQSQHDRKCNDFITRTLDYILDHNFFSFCGSYHLQTCGVVMGTSCAPFYANIYLGKWEQEFLAPDENRYIDDILIIWNGPEKLMNDCLKK